MKQNDNLKIEKNDIDDELLITKVSTNNNIKMNNDNKCTDDDNITGITFNPMKSTNIDKFWTNKLDQSN